MIQNDNNDHTLDHYLALFSAFNSADAPFVLLSCSFAMNSGVERVLRNVGAAPDSIMLKYTFLKLT